MKRTKLGIVAVAAAGALALAACGSSGSSSSSSDSSSKGGPSQSGSKASDFKKCDVKKGVKDASKMKIGGSEKKDITIAAFSGWPESAASGYLMKDTLEDKGYNVTVKQMEPAPAFAAVSKGNYDAVTDVWLPSTHKKYIDKFGSKMEAQGCWNADSTIELAVPKYSPAKSIGDLKTMASKYNNEIIGIEPGAGETGTMKDKTIPKYGLQKLDFKTSSSNAMLNALDAAYKKKKNIAVTLWSPHWAYSKYDLRKLKDPKNAMSGKEGLWNFGHKGFGKDHPLASQIMTNLTWTQKDLNELEDLMVQKYDNKHPEKAVKDFKKKHPDIEKNMVKGSMKSS